MTDSWANFRNLCNYYADCVKYSEHSQEYLFPNQLGKEFMIPRLPVDWHLKDDVFIVDTSTEDAYIRARLLAASDEDELYIGYPINSFVSPEGNECLCPILMFPVEIAVRGAGYTTGMQMRVDRHGISINQDWIDYHIPRSEQKAFRSACEHTEDEMGRLDVKMVLDFISAHFKTITVNPNLMQFAVRNSESRQKLLNTAVLFRGTKTKYTKNLISELHRIAREPDAVLDKTALAYVFRDPPLKCEEIEEKRVPVSFTSRPLNAGQFDAVGKSLNERVVKVMGPPGTGKSFMSVNLIANEVLYGGSVVFTSKNHKAIHAIYDKAPDVIQNKDFPLVSFCTTPDNPTNADWLKAQKDVDARVGRIKAINKVEFDELGEDTKSVNQSLSSDHLEIWQSTYRDAEKHIKRYQDLRNVLSQYERAIDRIELELARIPKEKRDSSELENLLHDCERLLSLSVKKSFLHRLIDKIKRIYQNRDVGVDVRAQLALIAPEFASAIVSHRTIKKEIRRLLKLVKYKRLLKEWERSEFEAIELEQSEINFEELKSVVKKSVEGARNVVQAAYIERLKLRVEGVEKADAIVAHCRDCISNVQKRVALDFLSSVDDASRYDEPLNCFREFLNIFPAWACTMLSLRKASPCLPGVFSLAIIDEASQCEIPPMIPVLFRSQRVAIVGDPNQFPPVVTLKETKDKMFRKKYCVSASAFNKYAYTTNNAFSVVQGDPVLLNEHFRCADEIAEYFNDEFYNGELSLCCDAGRDGSTAVGALKPGMLWVDAPGGDAAEIDSALEYLRMLKTQNFKGTIGIISPLRELANLMKTKVAEISSEIPEQLDIHSHINTANGFQGGECDIILFLLGLNSSRSHGQEWYITATENKYIYNVSVSRAKRLFVGIGDKKRAVASGLSYIKKLIPETRPPQKAKIGKGEDRLRIALQKAGVVTCPQYPVLNRYLDLAIPDKKIDIEVDGQAWHVDSRGCRKADDIHRDIQLEAAGWKVVRFWHYEVMSNTNECVAKVNEIISGIR